ncbi:hypothetical protein [Dickeya fangzhongdai]|uniref:hypothetical protein n=1 Tax=Dickeya fangzhongdai TaxID=1778540 RepID=UPI003B97AFE4
MFTRSRNEGMAGLSVDGNPNMFCSNSFPVSSYREGIEETGKVFNYANLVFPKYISVGWLFPVDTSPAKLPGFD